MVHYVIEPLLEEYKDGNEDESPGEDLIRRLRIEPKESVSM